MTGRRLPGLMALVVLLAGTEIPAPAWAATGDREIAAESGEGEAARASHLLERAVRRMNADGDKALAEFSRAGEFVDDDLYVYVLSDAGEMLASGGSSRVYVGRNMLEYTDPDGKHPFQEILAGARSAGSGSVSYRWLNLRDGKVEPKRAYFQAVKDRVVVAGYYVPRATADQARAMLWRAVDELNRDGSGAFARFDDLNGGYVRDDTYVFVVGLDDFRMYAHGATPRLVGRNVADLTDLDGKPIIRRMVAIARSKGDGTLDYRWRNPVTGKIEHKRTFLHRVGQYVLGVGYYVPE